MVQRSPTYVVAFPDTDWIANALRKFLPEKIAYAITRWKNVAYQDFIYSRTRTKPEKIKNMLIKLVRDQLGPDYDVETHFTPRYNPWDQRLCLVPNGDLFTAIKSGNASVVTDHVDTFTETGLRLRSGKELEADIIVTATGLNLTINSGIDFYVDDRAVDFSKTFTYKGIMYSGVPNLVKVFGYINASWTLRSDIIAEYTTRLLNHMDQHGFRHCAPHLSEADHNMPARPFIENFSSNYMQRVMSQLPKQGDHAPWINLQNYKYEKKLFRRGAIDDGVMIFSKGDMPLPVQREQVYYTLSDS